MIGDSSNPQGARMNRKLKASVAVATLLLIATATQAQVGTLQGVVSGVPAGTVLAVFKGDAKVADIKVEAGGKYSLALNTGVYTVKCPNGNTPKIAALNGSANVNINCQ
jgi:hypothetical protein